MISIHNSPSKSHISHVWSMPIEGFQVNTLDCPLKSDALHTFRVWFLCGFSVLGFPYHINNKIKILLRFPCMVWMCLSNLGSSIYLKILRSVFIHKSYESAHRIRKLDIAFSIWLLISVTWLIFSFDPKTSLSFPIKPKGMFRP
jgi:uncharacterized membrane protein YcgQ (UPF0703/DUF1980 family)